MADSLDAQHICEGYLVWQDDFGARGYLQYQERGVGIQVRRGLPYKGKLESRVASTECLRICAHRAGLDLWWLQCHLWTSQRTGQLSRRGHHWTLE